MPAIAIFYFLLGIGKTRWDAASAMTVGATVVGVDLLLVPRIGMPGLGWGLIAGVLVRWGFLVLIWRAHFEQEVRFGSFSLQVFAPAAVGVATLVALTGIHDRLGWQVGWGKFLGMLLVYAGVAAAIQIGVAELLPGGSQRRRDVVSSFRPIVEKALGLLPRGRA
jgi:hypothetical protein